jgi:hypothetical protein
LTQVPSTSFPEKTPFLRDWAREYTKCTVDGGLQDSTLVGGVVVIVSVVGEETDGTGIVCAADELCF